MKTKLIVAAFAVAATIGVSAQPVSAGGEVIPLDCGGTQYLVATNGNGAWTPGRDTANTHVFIPSSFGEFTGTFTPNDGSDPFTFTDPPMVSKSQASAHNGAATFAECTFHIEFTDPYGSFVGDGSVSGWMAPARGH